MRSYYYNTGYEEEPHFLDSCSLCHKKLSHNRDIYMYRGNKPYCSQECRQEQIAMDEANEKRLKLSSSKRSTANSSVRKTTAEDECDLTKKAVAVA